MNNNGEYYQKAFHENMVLYGIANMGYKKDSMSIINFFRVAGYYIYYHFKNDRAKIIAEKFLNTIQQDAEYSIKLINLNKDPLLGPILSYKMMDVKEHHLILVPKMLKETNLAVINSMLRGEFDPHKFMVSNNIDPDYCISKNEDVYDSSKYVQIRILCKSKIPIRIKTKTHRSKNQY